MLEHQFPGPVQGQPRLGRGGAIVTRGQGLVAPPPRFLSRVIPGQAGYGQGLGRVLPGGIQVAEGQVGRPQPGQAGDLPARFVGGCEAFYRSGKEATGFFWATLA